MLVKRAVPLAAALATALVLIPTAASGNYADASGDAFGGAGDITSVTVSGDKTSGQVVFQISGSNLASSEDNELYIDIDADANPATGSQTDNGAEYGFSVGNDSYGFGRWDGSRWVDTPRSTVRVFGNPSRITISVNLSELGNPAGFNFVATTFALTRISPTAATVGLDTAPDDGAFN